MKTNLPVRPPLPVLPQEIILQIISNIEADSSKDPQRTLWAACLLARNWYAGGVSALYRYPRLTSKNYDQFVDTVCPSINPHVKKTDLAGMVQVLDLSQLVFAGTKSFIARLLRRLKDSLEVLNAPQTSFGVNSLAALSKCLRLRTLDLSLVTESIPVIDFFRVISKLDALENLHLPRASLARPLEGPGTRASTYPPNLKHLVIPGKIARVLSAHAPDKTLDITSLHLQEVPLDYWDLDYLTKISPHLESLTIREPASRSTRFEPAVWSAMLDRFSCLKSLRLEYFSSLHYLFSTVVGTTDDERIGALDSLEELVIGPVSTGAEMLRSMNRPFDIEASDDMPEMDLLDFIDELPRFRRLVLLLHSSPRTVLQGAYGDYQALSSYLQEDAKEAAKKAEEAGEDHHLQVAGVFWARTLPPVDVTDPRNAQLQLLRLDQT